VTALVIDAVREVPVARRRFELVERKGLGHPDTVCDSLVEAASLALNRMYLAKLGAIAHYNVDKALLVAGQCPKGFGWGAVTRPMELVIGDRATFTVDGTTLPVEETVRSAVDAWIGDHLPDVRPGRDIQTRVVLAPASAELRGIFGRGRDAVASNDTSGACGYAPLTPTEGTVLAVERFLNGDEFKRAFPDTGRDVKVFALREDDRLALTIAMPLGAHATASEAAYFGRKDEILALLVERFDGAPFALDVRLNNLDRPGRGSDGTYLTVTGTSAEDADSGQVGRGNRANGLIAFARPAGGEAAAGKNPVAHVGKVYSVLSDRLARAIHARCAEALLQVSVSLAARIGEPVDQPWTGIQVILAEGADPGDVKRPIQEVVESELARYPAFQAELIRGEHPLC
jgi:S-adenosylmethionine synthetase